MRRTNHVCSIKWCHNLLDPTVPWKMCETHREKDRVARKRKADRDREKKLYDAEGGARAQQQQEQGMMTFVMESVSGRGRASEEQGRPGEDTEEGSARAGIVSPTAPGELTSALSSSSSSLSSSSLSSSSSTLSIQSAADAIFMDPLLPPPIVQQLNTQSSLASPREGPVISVVGTPPTNASAAPPEAVTAAVSNDTQTDARATDREEPPKKLQYGPFGRPPKALKYAKLYVDTVTAPLVSAATRGVVPSKDVSAPASYAATPTPIPAANRPSAASSTATTTPPAPTPAPAPAPAPALTPAQAYPQPQRPLAYTDATPASAPHMQPQFQVPYYMPPPYSVPYGVGQPSYFAPVGLSPAYAAYSPFAPPPPAYPAYQPSAFTSSPFTRPYMYPGAPPASISGLGAGSGAGTAQHAPQWQPYAASAPFVNMNTDVNMYDPTGQVRAFSSSCSSCALD